MTRPVVAIVSNALTPYRLHFHRRLVRELTGFEWWSLFTHDVSNAPWSAVDEAEINPVRFGPGERSDDQSRWTNAWHEYCKGGHVIRWLKEHAAQAVVLLGYNDAGRVRILNWCHRHRVPCLLFGDSNFRGDTASGWRGRVKRWMVPRWLQKCAAVLSCGSLGRDYFVRYGVSPEKIFYVPYEPDYQMIAGVTEPDIATARQRFSLPDQPTILYCGRLAREKRVDLLLQAFAAMAADRPQWQLVLVGEGPERQALRALVPGALVGRVHWLGFVDDQRLVAALQRSADILVLPSDFEPWGVVINEGVAAGCAVVASSAVGAAAELVRDDVNGRLFTPGDLAGLTRALKDVTQPAKSAEFRAASGAVLAQWRGRADPVAGLAQALAACGVTPPPDWDDGRAPAVSTAHPAAPNTDTGRRK